MIPGASAWSAARSGAVAAAGALALASAGCGSSHSQRPEVAGYIGQLNKIEQAAAKPLTSVTQAGNRFSTEQGSGPAATGAPDTTAQQELLGAIPKLSALRARAAALPVPVAALKLRSLVLQLFDAQMALTREVSQLIVFLPQFGAALKPLAPAANKLAGVLSQTSAAGTYAVSALYASKAAALRNFQKAVNGVYRKIRALSPPDVSRPEWAAQLDALYGMSLNAGKLAGAIGSGNLTGVQPLLLAFDKAAASNHTIAAQKAQIAAVKAYDAAVGQVSTLAGEIQSENARLANNLK